MSDHREAYNALMKFYPLTLDDLPDELWHPIKYYEKCYHVSNYGRVKSFCKGKFLIRRPRLIRGYLSVNLYSVGGYKWHRVHRLVAEAFMLNPLNKPQVNHIDGHPLNNHVSNLEWVTASENMRHADATGLRAMPQGGANPLAKLSNADAKYIRDNPDRLTGRALAEMFCVNENTISAIQRGKKYRNASGNIREARHISPRVPDDVRGEIRQLYVYGSREFGSRALAKRFGVNHQTILNVVREVNDGV